MLNLYDYVKSYQDFPKQEILFHDISPLLKNPKAFKQLLSYFDELFKPETYDAVAGIESRGFLFGSGMALHHHKPLVLIRKKGKLPGHTIGVDYELEYGKSELEVQAEMIYPGERVLIMDDVLATGGTARAAAELITRAGGQVVGFGFVIKIAALLGEALLADYKVETAMSF